MTSDAHVHLDATRRLAGLSIDPAAGFRQVFDDLVHDSRADGASQVDVRYNPARWAERGWDATRQLNELRWIRRRASEDHGIDLTVWVTLKQEGAPAQWAFSLDTAVAGKSAGIVGVDVSHAFDPASSKGPDTADTRFSHPLAEVVRSAYSAGLVVAWHLGQWDGPDAVDLALELGASRIGHGVPLIDDDRWDAAFAERGTIIEVCPTAFRRHTGRPLGDIPVDRWIDQGLQVMVGTDHPKAWGTRIGEEIRRLETAWPSLRAHRAGGL